MSNPKKGRDIAQVAPSEPGSAAKPNAVVVAMNDALSQFSRDIAGKLKAALSN